MKILISTLNALVNNNLILVAIRILTKKYTYFFKYSKQKYHQYLKDIKGAQTFSAPNHIEANTIVS